MVRKTLIASVLLVMNVVLVHAQDDYIQPGLLKGTATISPSTMLNRSVNNVYISGFLEYHLTKNLSLRGESYWFVDGTSKTESNNLFIGSAIRTYAGAFYHFNKNNWDKYIGFQPGIAVMQPLAGAQPIQKLQACPSLAVHVGSTYYVWKYFNFFVDLAYVKSTFYGLQTGAQKTDELILSAGLGFQIQTKKN